MNRKKFLMGNWKMNNTIAESKEFCNQIQSSGLVRLARNKGIVIGVNAGHGTAGGAKVKTLLLLTFLSAMSKSTLTA